MNTAETIALDILTAIVNNVGIEQLVKLVVAAVGPDNAARVRAALAAEYVAVDAAVDVLEEQKLHGAGG